MNQIIVLVADTLQVVRANKYYPDTTICRVISPQDTSLASINWTMVIITALIAAVLIVWIISKALLRYEKMNFCEKSHYVDLLTEENAKINANKDSVDMLKKLLKELKLYS